MKRIIMSLLVALASANTFAATLEDEPTGFWRDQINYPLTPYLIVIALLAVVLLVMCIVAIYVFRFINMLNEQTEREQALKLGKAYVPSQSYWAQLITRMNDAVPVAQEETIEMDHSYDGIKELDNHLPPWWKWLFYGTIAWSVVYMIVYHITDSLPLSIEEYHQEVAVAEQAARVHQASQPQQVIDENALTYTPDPAILSNGKEVFMSNNCGACHRNDGGGNGVGPNLTDQYWLHGGDITSIFHTINTGVVEKGMPAWGKSMKPKDVRDVAFFVMSLQGSNPQDAKAPQGDLVNQPPHSLEKDSTEVQAKL